MTKALPKIKRILESIIISGFIILLIGLFYMMIKASIPYQDPPLELQIRYAVNIGIGRELIMDGFRIILIGGMLRLFIRIHEHRPTA